MEDSLGDRMKAYEKEAEGLVRIPNGSYVVIRLDGKAFHSFTKGFNRPYDEDLMEVMNETTKYLCENIQGAKFGYVQSDEISIFLTDLGAGKETQIWYNGEVKKILSVSASMAAAKFNDLIRKRTNKLAAFDCRLALVMHDLDKGHEVANNFIWRQQDAKEMLFQWLLNLNFLIKNFIKKVL